MAARVFPKAKSEFLKGNLDLTADDIRVLLVASNSAYRLSSARLRKKNRLKASSQGEMRTSAATAPESTRCVKSAASMSTSTKSFSFRCREYETVSTV